MEPIQVYVRLRPDDTNQASDCCVQCDTTDNTITIFNNSSLHNGLYSTKENQQNGFSFQFDKVFPANASQEDVFDHVVHTIKECFKGFDVTVFAYGTTGSGKTHTMSGSYSDPGILYKSIRYIFSSLQAGNLESDNQISMIFLSYIELYNNILYDLLDSTSTMSSVTESTLKLHEHPSKGIIVTGSPSLRTPVHSSEEAIELIAKGNKLRATSSTNLNARSSRSHTVIIFDIITKEFNTEENREIVKTSKINLVDLAGSERLKMSGAEGTVKDETKHINKALTCLGDVLNALSKHYIDAHSNGSTKALGHIPYRDSKLTMLLKSSLGGHTKTIMLATIRNSTAFYQLSLMTLRYAARTRHIKNVPIKNIHNAEAIENKVSIEEKDENEFILQSRMIEISNLKKQLKIRSDECEKLNNLLMDIHSKEKSNEIIESEKIVDEVKLNYEKRLEDLRQQNITDQNILKDRVKYIIVKKNAALKNELNDKESIINELIEKQSLIELQKEKVELTNRELHRKLKEGMNTIHELQEAKSKLEIEGTKSNTADDIPEVAYKALLQSKEKYKSKTIQLTNVVKELRETVEYQVNTLSQLSKSICQTLEYNTNEDNLKDAQQINFLSFIKIISESVNSYVSRSICFNADEKIELSILKRLICKLTNSTTYSTTQEEMELMMTRIIQVIQKQDIFFSAIENKETANDPVDEKSVALETLVHFESELNKIKNDATEKVSALSKQLENLMSVNTEKEMIIKSKNAEIDILKAEFCQYREKCAQQFEEFESNKILLKASMQEGLRLTTLVHNLDKKLNDTQATIANNSQEIESLRKENVNVLSSKTQLTQNLEAKLQTYMKRVTELEQAIDECKQEELYSSEHHTMLNCKLRDLEKNMSEVLQKFEFSKKSFADEFKVQQEHYEKIVGSLSKAQDAYIKELQKYELLVSKMTIEHNESNERHNQEVETLNSTYMNRINSLESNIAFLMTEKSNLQQSNQNLKHQVDEVTSKAQADLLSANLKTENLEAKLNNIEKISNDVKSKNKNLDSQVMKFQKDQHELEQINNKLSNQILELQSNCQIASSNVVLLTKSLENLQLNYDMLLKEKIDSCLSDQDQTSFSLNYSTDTLDERSLVNLMKSHEISMYHQLSRKIRELNEMRVQFGEVRNKLAESEQRCTENENEYQQNYQKILDERNEYESKYNDLRVSASFDKEIYLDQRKQLEELLNTQQQVTISLKQELNKCQKEKALAQQKLTNILKDYISLNS